MPLLSICIPTFNRKHYLENVLAQIQGLLQNQDLDLEICISDNCSDDGTWEYINEVASQSSKIKIKRQAENIGGNRNLIDITSIASGKWILVIGDDDTLIEENLLKLTSILPSLDSYEYVLLNTKISEDQNLFKMQDGPLSKARLESNLAEGIYNFGFCGSHLISQKVAKTMRKRNYEDLRSWPSFGTFIYSAFRKDTYFFSLPVAWQDRNGHAMEWQANHWLQLVFRQLQIFRINYLDGVKDSFRKRLIRKHLFSIQFIKIYYSSFLYLPKDTYKIIHGYEYTQLLNDLPSYLSSLHRALVFIPTLMPLKIHYFFIRYVLQKNLNKYIFTGNLDEKDGLTQDPEILTKSIKEIESNNLFKKGSVCFFNYNLAFGGTEKVIVSLANNFIASGRQVTILTVSDENDFKSSIHPDIKLVCLGLTKIRSSIPSLASYLFSNRVDNFIANVWPITSLSFFIRIFRWNTRLIFIEHCHLSEQYKDNPIFFRVLQKLSIYISHRFAHSIVAVSNGVKDDLITTGLGRDYIKVIYNPVVSKSSHKMDETNLAIHSWSQSLKIKLIAAGELKPQKNFLNLLDAVYYAKNELGLNLSLLILGDGAQRSMIENKIYNLDLKDNIFLAGWVDDPLPYFKSADLFVLSSDYEGFGMVIAEALSQGLNVVATDCKSGPSEILQNGSLGFLSEVKNSESLGRAIDFALKNPIEPSKLIARSNDFSEKKVTSLYEEIII
tara:strand:- start:1523 stop:3694 length:2172 start_codon:yes stop_codon:yes gene_type:complete